MTDQKQNIEQICALVARQVQDGYKNLNLHFILHGKAQFNEAAALCMGAIAKHPAFGIAELILERKYDEHIEDSQFLGLAVMHESKLMGLISSDAALGLININTEKYDDIKEARRHIYHLAWHALDVATLRQNPDYKGKLKSGPMVPKRSAMNLAKANMQADVFAAAVIGLQGEKDSIQSFAELRAQEALLPIADRHAEEYPFIIAMEAAQFAYAELTKSAVPKNKIIQVAYQLSLDVGQTFDENSIRQWWAYSDPAQDMAWRGHSKEEILGAAVNTSEDPFVRATGYLIAEVTKINPKAASELRGMYNAFTDAERNERLHREMMEKTFEDIMTISIEENSAEIFRSTANAQNENLTKGKIIGWCASSLQAAAKAFETALLNGSSPGQAARLEFEGARRTTTWDAIMSLGQSIVEQRRMGYALTLGHIAELCSGNKNLASIMDSLKDTMNDPNYVASLAPANDLAMSPAPSGPVFAPAPQAAPQTPSPAPSAPGLGLGGTSSRPLPQRPLPEQEESEQNAQSSEKSE